jgi:competence protein ComEA
MQRRGATNSPILVKEHAMSRWFSALLLAFAAQVAVAAVNPNTATKEELLAVTGIGPARAPAILDYRAQHGEFKSVDELKDVKGIGARRFETLKAEFTVTPGAAKPTPRVEAKAQAVAAKGEAAKPAK